MVEKVDQNIGSNRYNSVSLVSPVSHLPKWVSGPPHSKEAAQVRPNLKPPAAAEPQPEPSAFIAVEDLPAIVRQAFAEVGIEVDVLVVGDAQAEPQVESEAAEAWDEAIPVEDVKPCPACGSLELWWSFKGEQCCQKCQPPLQAERLRAKAARLRRRANRRMRRQKEGVIT